MNCRSARQLISPYLDGQLTGREMLALGDHLAGCEACQHEMQSLRQLKSLLRGLAAPRPPLEFSRQLTSQEIYTQSVSWRIVSLPPRPQRGRRLLAALALSCLTLAVFAPASRDGRTPPVGARLSALPAFAGPVPQGMLLPPSNAASDPASDPAAGSAIFALNGAPRQGMVTFAGMTAFDRSFAYPPSYQQPLAPVQSDKPVFIRYRRR